MGTFAYTARDHAGSPASGTLVANTIAEAIQLLRADGKYPTSIKPAGEAAAGTSEGVRFGRRGLRMSRRDLIQLSTQLAIMVDTGVTLSESLQCIADQADKPNVKGIVSDISQQVQEGGDLSSALQRHPRAFPRLFIALVSASEKSGMMAKLLNRATQYLRDEYEAIRRIRGALTYPAIMLWFAISTTTFLLTFVLPRFTAIYASKKAALPAPTRVLMAISGLVVHQWLWLLMGIAAGGFGLMAFFSTRPGKRTFDWVQLHVPLIGGLFHKVYLARGLRMIGTMAGAGISLVDGVKTAHDLVSNTYYQDLWENVSQQIQQGRQLSEPLFQSKLVPKSIAQMLHSAEKGGKLAQVMEQVATYSEEELKEKIAEMTKYIEPIMITVMGAIIGGVAMALMLPIFTISKVIAR
ncbi:MAG: type II secretion system F family protein [Tepidisphaeraceae bacterium]|jgi:type IV pilus assembly protein PilC